MTKVDKIAHSFIYGPAKLSLAGIEHLKSVYLRTIENEKLCNRPTKKFETLVKATDIAINILKEIEGYLCTKCGEEISYMQRLENGAEKGWCTSCLANHCGVI